MSITKRPYRNLVDFEQVYQFMVKNYAMDCRRGAAAPFFEYAQVLYWTDRRQLHRNAIWEDDGRMVAFCYYESQIGKAFISLADGYDCLIPEMIAHAEQRLSTDDGELEFCIYASQTAVIAHLQRLGYTKDNEWVEGIYDFRKGPLDYPLPEGFAFEEPDQIDMWRRIQSTWRGFDHDTYPEHGVEAGYHISAAPHATPELDVVIKNAAGEYVCSAGMWWVPENRLAYLEPLCTVPDYRRMGLASAALSELYRKTLALGATHMTGGGNPLYFAIGYEGILRRSIWKKLQ